MLGLWVHYISSHWVADKLFPVNPGAIMAQPKFSLLLKPKRLPYLSPNQDSSLCAHRRSWLVHNVQPAGTDARKNLNSISSNSTSSNRTDCWIHFHHNAGLRLFVHTWSVHGVDDCYQLNWTFGGFSAQCLSKLFLKEFTVLLLTISCDTAFLVVVILIGSKFWVADVLKFFTINLDPLFLVLSLRS